MNYAARFSQDKNNYPYLYISAVSKQTQKGSPSASSVITLSPDTTTIEVTAVGSASGNSLIIGKWGSASVTTTNWDFCVQSGQSKLLAVPINTVNAQPASMAGANAANGLFSTIAVNNALAVAASVFTAEYQ